MLAVDRFMGVSGFLFLIGFYKTLNTSFSQVSVFEYFCYINITKASTW